MQSVFISSVITGFEAVRAAVHDAVESAGFRPVMSEKDGASPLSSQRALLDRVASSDIYLVILGARYGDPAASGLSPTEEEFDEAKRRNRPILGLRQNIEMEPAQIQFARRVGGTWEDGRLYADFNDERDVAFKVVRALTNLRDLGNTEALGTEAQERARLLAEDDETRGRYGGSSIGARIAIAPLIGGVIIDELMLEDPTLPDDLSTLARSGALVPHSLGITAEVTAKGVRLSAGESHNPTTRVLLARDGSIVVEAQVTGGDRTLGSMSIDPERLAGVIMAAARFAEQVWLRVDQRSEIQQVAITCAIPNASGRVFGRPSGSSISFGQSHSLPSTVIAPIPPRIARRQDISTSEIQQSLMAAIRRVFADAGAVID